MAPLYEHHECSSVSYVSCTQVAPILRQHLLMRTESDNVLTHHAKTSTMLNPAGSLVFSAKLASCTNEHSHVGTYQ